MKFEIPKYAIELLKYRYVKETSEICDLTVICKLVDWNAMSNSNFGIYRGPKPETGFTT